jgi:hypothetical protein
LALKRRITKTFCAFTLRQSRELVLTPFQISGLAARQEGLLFEHFWPVA